MRTTKPTQEIIMSIVKYVFASVIIVLGGIGYYRLFNNGGWSFSMFFIIFLFVMVEVAIMSITTVKFSSHIKQQKGINLFLYLSIFIMWIIAGTGIDSTIWHLIEDKYQIVKQDEAKIEANQIKFTNLHTQLSELKNAREILLKKEEKIENLKTATLKDINKYDRNLRGIIYSVANCNESADCLDRKNSAIQNKNVALDALKEYNKKLDSLHVEFKENKTLSRDMQLQIDEIKNTQAVFEQTHRATLDNQKAEAITQVWLMDFMNRFFGVDLSNPTRAFVMLLSFVVYPIYILFVAFASANTQEMKKLRAKTQEEKKKQKVYRATILKTTNTLLRKIAFYLVTTRVRKVKTVEVEVQKEIEVEKIVYRDGKEIVKVEVEKPVIVEQEKIVEKVVYKPIVQKELVVVPAGFDAEELNRLSKRGIKPERLDKETQKKQGHTTKTMQGFKYDRYHTA